MPYDDYTPEQRALLEYRDLLMQKRQQEALLAKRDALIASRNAPPPPAAPPPITAPIPPLSRPWPGLSEVEMPPEEVEPMMMVRKSEWDALQKLLARSSQSVKVPGRKPKAAKKYKVVQVGGGPRPTDDEDEE